MSEQTTLNGDWMANLRLRAERGDSLCLHEHTIHRSDDDRYIWLTCDSPTGPHDLGRLDLGPPTSQDRSDEIRYFVASTTAAHERRAADDAVLALLAALGF